jgi:hypothetical protein
VLGARTANVEIQDLKHKIPPDALIVESPPSQSFICSPERTTEKKLSQIKEMAVT